MEHYEVKMQTNNVNQELFAAIAKAQSEIENASKNASNKHLNSKYADLSEILNTVRPVFSANGIGFIQSPSFDGSIASVTTVVTHTSGGWIAGTASCAPTKLDAQGIGSATTYLRRYSLAAMAGIAQEDDDGAIASGSGVSESAAELSVKFAIEIPKAGKDRLAEIGSALGKAGLPSNLLKPLRDLWAARNKELANEPT